MPSFPAGAEYRSHTTGLVMWLYRTFQQSQGDPSTVTLDYQPGGGITVEYGCGCEWHVNIGTVGKRLQVPLTCPAHANINWQPASTFLGNTQPVGEVGQVAPPELELVFDTEPLTGWRSFRVGHFERRGGIVERRLASLTGREVWEPRRRAEARCLPNNLGMGYHGGLPVHEAPWPTCHCGIWATREAAPSVVEGVRAGAAVLAQVRLWGRVLEFKRGWRAQYAYPCELLIGGSVPDADAVAVELGALYRVPARVTRDKEARLAAPSVSFNAATSALAKAMEKTAAEMVEALQLSSAPQKRRRWLR